MLLWCAVHGLSAVGTRGRAGLPPPSAPFLPPSGAGAGTGVGAGAGADSSSPLRFLSARSSLARVVPAFSFFSAEKEEEEEEEAEAEAEAEEENEEKNGGHQQIK